jgi:hypothetical protein
MKSHCFSLIGAAMLAVAALVVGGASPALAVTGTGTGTVGVNPFAYLEPGEHTITRAPAMLRDVGRNFKSSFVWNPIVGDLPCGYDGGDANMGYVHVYENDGGNWCTVGSIYQEAVKFDFSDFQNVKLWVLDAHLQYDETMVDSRAKSGATIHALDCVERFARPTIDWSQSNDLIPNEDESYQGTRGNWDVTFLIQRAIGSPAEDHGILLRGTVESEDDDNSACLSRVSNVHLVLHYSIST